jgi:aminoglycoside phosphotransferase (APT) family kinase protein
VTTDEPDRAGIELFLIRAGLHRPGRQIRIDPLPGGVSSDIALVSFADAPALVVKRALARLRVSAEWTAPVERSRYEARWLDVVGTLAPGTCPRLLGYEETSGYLAMEALDPATHPVWKAMLLAGAVDPAVATAVGTRLAAAHSRTAADPALAARFDTGDLFEALRVNPYLRAVARRHPDLAPDVDRLVDRLTNTRVALVHGDVSPKNILIGPAGPVLLDAECAWWGDPAFDLAFCVNHLLLKSLARPRVTDALRESAHALATAYRAGIRWEPAAAVDGRAAALLPALLLARVDGDSPVEYLDATHADLIRRTAPALVRQPPSTVEEMIIMWRFPR